MPRSVHRVWFRSSLRQAIGLMLQRPAPDTLYVFDFRTEVHHTFHTWFCLASIDIRLLDAHGRVIEQRLAMGPWRLFRPRRRYRYAIESAAGLKVPKQLL